jgi:hypothetical protein
MKLISALVATASIVATASATVQNLQTADLQLNISSPLMQGVYVAGQILPCSYTPAVPSSKSIA